MAAFATVTEDGVYHDVFLWRLSTGRAKIAELIDDWF